VYSDGNCVFGTVTSDGSRCNSSAVTERSDDERNEAIGLMYGKIGHGMGEMGLRRQKCERDQGK